MSNPQPLSYGSLKSVIKYMDVNKRFELLTKCPSIRTAEKATPLKINKLLLSSLGIFIDGTKYMLSVIRHPKNNWSVLHDVDKYGFRTRSIDVTLGDVFVEDDNPITEEQERELDNRFLDDAERELRCLTQNLEAIEKRERVLKSGALNRLKLNIKANIEKMKSRILPYILRRDNAEPPHTYYIEFCKVSPGEKEYERETLNYNKKVYDAMKYMMEKLFGGRRQPIQINNLAIYSRSIELYKLPLNLKLAIKNLKVFWRASKIIEAFRPVLDDTSFPLESIDVGRLIEFENNPIVSSARKLVISGSPMSELPLFHHRVHFSIPNLSSMAQDVLFPILEHWIQHGREIGTYYSFSVSEKPVAQKFLDSMEKLPGAKIAELMEIRETEFFKCVMIPMRNDVAELNVYCQASAEVNLRWKLNAKVQPRGHANVVE